MKPENIAILSTVINFDLYTESSKSFPNDIQKYVIDGRTGMYGIDSIYYMMEKLKNANIEWLIMLDEDVFIFDDSLLFEVISEMKNKNYIVSGIRDGGEVLHRENSPYAINTFFSILNFKKVLELWDKNEIKKQQYILPNEFNENLSAIKGKYNPLSIFEPYYCFYFWLLRKGEKILYLNATMMEDNISNTIEFNNKLIGVHTWYARAYNSNQKHTDRINLIKSGVKNSKENTSPPILFFDSKFKIKKDIMKVISKIKAKINSFK